jgi:hypothetical protein
MATQKRSVEYEPNFLAGFLTKAKTIVAEMMGENSVTAANKALAAESVTAANLKKEELTSTQIKPRGIAAASLAIAWKRVINVATTEALNGEPEAIGETLLSKKEEKLKVDGKEPVAGNTILVKNEVAAQNDGIYEVVKAGKAGEKWELKRTTDANTAGELNGAVVYVFEGTANGKSFWLQSGAVTTVGTTAQVWEPHIGTESIRALAVTAAKIAKETITEEKLAKAIQEKITPTAWEGLTLGTKVEAGTLQTPGVRAEDGKTMARLRGSPKVKAAEEVKAGETIATIPAGFRPPSTVHLATMNPQTGVAGELIIASTGVITAAGGYVAANEILLDGLSFNLT